MHSMKGMTSSQREPVAKSVASNVQFICLLQIDWFVNIATREKWIKSAWSIKLEQ